MFVNGGARVPVADRFGRADAGEYRGLAAFNPLTTTPVGGHELGYGANFGTPLNRFAFTSPRTFRMTFGVRF